MNRAMLTAASTISLWVPLAAGELRAIEGFGHVKPDVDLVMGFERCGAPPALYARLQDELLFAAGAESLSRGIASLAGVEAGSGVEGLLVAVRGAELLAVVPVASAQPSPRGPEATGSTRQLRTLDERRVAYGDLSLLRDGDASSARSAPLESPPIGEPPAGRCAWLIARPAWVRGEGGASAAAADVAGRSVLRSLEGVRSLTLTADFSSEVEIALRVTSADSEDAAVLADALEEFLATRRRNRDAPEAVRVVVERGAVQRRAEAVTLRLALSEAALDRIRRNADSRALLRLRLEDAERERWQKVADIARALDVDEGDSVADVGAGEGFFSVRLARAVGRSGRVFAVEISEKAVAALSRRAEAGSLVSIQAVLGANDDPHLAKGSLDAALIVNAYHEMPSHEAMLARLFEALKPGGRLVLVEPWAARRRGEPRAAQLTDHLIAPELVEDELRRAGFEIGARHDDFIPGDKRPQWLIQARRPKAAIARP